MREIVSNLLNYGWYVRTSVQWVLHRVALGKRKMSRKSACARLSGPVDIFVILYCISCTCITATATPFWSMFVCFKNLAFVSNFSIFASQCIAVTW
jgi:hypothetical protein